MEKKENKNLNEVIEEMNKLANSLDNALLEINLEEQKRIIQEMERIYTEYGDAEGIAQEYARGLVNLSVVQGIHGKVKEVKLTIENALKGVYEKNPKDQEIAREYAKGLVFLSAAQFKVGKFKEVEVTVESILREVYEKNQKDQEIAREYAKGLVFLSAAQGIERKYKELRETVENVLKAIYEKNPQDQEITLQYATGLVYLSIEQALERKYKEVEETIENVLKAICEKNPQDQKIRLQYARGLVLLSAAQFKVVKFKGVEITVENVLKEIYEKNPQDQEIARLYARGLVNLSRAQVEDGKFKEAERTIQQTLKKLYEEHEEDNKIAWIYAKGLVNLSRVQVEDGKFEKAEKTIQQTLKKLYKRNEEDQEIAREYAKGLTFICKEYAKVKKYEKLGGAFKILETVYERTGDSFKLEDTESLLSEIMLVEKNENDANELVDLRKMIVDFLVERLEPEASQSFREILEQYKNSGDEENYILLMKTYLYMSRIKDALIIRDRSRLERENNRGSELGRYTKIRRLESVLLLKREKDNSNKSNSSRLIGRDSYENANLRMFNASYMNDPSEGKALLEYLRKNLLQDKEENSETKDSDANNETILDTLCRQYNEELGASDIYLLSLTQAIDFLPMWSMYGEQGKGCCLVYDLNSFDYPKQNSLGLSVRDDMGMIHEGFAEYPKQNSLDLSVRDNNSALSENIATEQKSNDNSGETNQSKALETKLPIYKVCYLSEANTDNKNNASSQCSPESNTDRSEEDSKELEDYLKGLGRSINKISLDGLDDKEKAKILALIKYILDEIRYLFKTDNYSFEQEYRLIKSVPIDDAKIKLQPISDSVPQLYIELDQKMEYKEIILGPKVEDPDYIAPYINYADRNIKVRKSKIEFR